MKSCYLEESGTRSEPISVMVGIITDRNKMKQTETECNSLLKHISIFQWYRNGKHSVVYKAVDNVNFQVMKQNCSICNYYNTCLGGQKFIIKCYSESYGLIHSSKQLLLLLYNQRKFCSLLLYILTMGIGYT